MLIRNIIGIGSLALALFAGPALADTEYFKWDVETQWSVLINGSSVPIISPYNSGTTWDCTVAHTGNCSMKMVVDGTGEGGMGIDVNGTLTYPFNIVNSPAIYYRWWMKIDPGFSWGTNTAKIKSSRVSASESTRGYTGYLMYYGFLIGECDDVGTPNGGGCLTNTGANNTDYNLYVPYDLRTMNDGRWHEYVVKVKANTSASCVAGSNCDAQLQVWIDGVSIGENNNWKLANDASIPFVENWQSWMIKPFAQLYGTASDGGIIWVDDFSTADYFNSTYSGGDIVAPTISNGAPSGVLSYGTTSTTLSVTTNENATCRYSTTDQTYAAMGSGKNFSTTGGTSHSTTLSGLTNGTSYTYYVRCVDATGNASTSSTIITFSVQAATGTPVNNECPSDWATRNPTWIWCDDFETDKLSNYFDTDWTYFSRTSGAGRNNSYGMRATYNTSRSDAGSLKVAFGAVPAGGGFTIPTGVSSSFKYTEIYYRFFIKSQDGWTNPSPPNNSKLSRATSFVASNWSQAMIAHLWSYEYNNVYLRSDPVSCVSGSTVVCTEYNDFANMTWLTATSTTAALFSEPYLGEWTCIEHHVKLNTAGNSNGVSQLWINGIEQFNTTGLNFVGSYTTYAINALLLENYINGNSPANQTRDWDNLVISTTRIGCLERLPGPGRPRWRPADAWHLWFARLETLH